MARVDHRTRPPGRGRLRWIVSAGVAASLATMGLSVVGGTLGAAAPSAGAVRLSAKFQYLHSLRHDISTVYKGAPKRGTLDCNGYSPVQKPLRGFECTDIHGIRGVNNANTWNGRFYDNGHYIGHDEPDTTFLSNKPGSGNNVSWNFTLGKDPAAMPTATHPGHSVVHYFELTPAPWFSMAMCDPNSYPQMPCTPRSNSNAPACTYTVDCPANSYPGGGSAFMEMQFYPPGNAPFYDNESCDNTHWCAAVTIDSLECTDQFVACNLACEEPVNFAFIQRNGVPDPDGGGFIPDSETLLMNPGDDLSLHMFDAPVPGHPKEHAFKVVIDDLTTGQHGSMQASAQNGFHTTSMVNCQPTPFNFQPEYNTAAAGNIVPWAALQTDISTEFEIGHFEPCTSLSQPFKVNPFDKNDTSTAYNKCDGPYERAGGPEGRGYPEYGDAICYAAGSTHVGYFGPGTSSPPNEISGCQDNLFQNGDLDFDGTPYYADWPTGKNPTATLPGSFVESLPTTNGSPYPQLFFQTDTGLSESGTPTVPPPGPGHFYPYWSEVKSGRTCALEFGNVATGTGVRNFRKDLEYGVDRESIIGYPEFEGNVLDNTCAVSKSQGFLLTDSAGELYNAGDAPHLGAVHAPPAPVAGLATTLDGQGTWAVTRSGVVLTNGDAVFHGDLTTRHRSASDIVGITATPSGNGYWLLGANGGVFGFGHAKFYGSFPSKGMHVTDAVALASSPTGQGYLIVTRNGQVKPFGDAKGHGSITSGVDDIVAILVNQSGSGYTLVGANGDTYPFGTDAPRFGSLAGKGVTDIVGAALTSDGLGYWMAGANGDVYRFGDAKALPVMVPRARQPVVAIAGDTTDLPWRL